MGAFIERILSREMDSVRLQNEFLEHKKYPINEELPCGKVVTPSQERPYACNILGAKF